MKSRNLNRHRPGYSFEYSRSEAGKIRNRKSKLKTKYNLSLENYEEMLKDQKGLCAICHRPERDTRNGVIKWLAVDHDHTTGENRQLLCSSCNIMLGKAKDSIEILQEAINYLKKHDKEREIICLQNKNTMYKVLY